MILITGFEPFDKAASNPSFEAIKLLPDVIEGERIEKLELPVVFGKAAEMVIERIESDRPDAVVMTGVAAGRDKITPEVIAVNLADARIPDNEGNHPKWESIVPDGPDGLFSTLHVNRIVSAIEDSGIRAGLSFSAGAYVCNDVFYRVCHHCRANDSAIPCGFIHVPFPKGYEKGSDLTMEDLARAMEIALGTVATYLCPK